MFLGCLLAGPWNYRDSFAPLIMRPFMLIEAFDAFQEESSDYSLVFRNLLGLCCPVWQTKEHCSENAYR